jgi:SEC-C motif
MKSGERSITKILDDGGPFVIWEKEKRGTFRRGIMLDTRVCDNPECRYLHFQAVAIDERYNNMKFKGRKFVYTVESDISHKTEPLPNQTLTASIHMDSAKISVHDDTSLEKKDQDFLRWLTREVRGDYFEVMKRRWRMAKKVDRDRWRNLDWSWWKPGLVVGWDEIYPDDPDFIFDISGTKYWARDLYCINPGCTCKDIKISFAEFYDRNNPKELGAVGIDLNKFRIDGIDAIGTSAENLTQIWQKFQKEAGVKGTIKARQKEMKIIGKEIAELSLKNKSKGLKSFSKAGPKVGRNDPCPCGSGKKYKKCCLNK